MTVWLIVCGQITCEISLPAAQIDQLHALFRILRVRHFYSYAVHPLASS
jgi:hypothetical protein